MAWPVTAARQVTSLDRMPSRTQANAGMSLRASPSDRRLNLVALGIAALIALAAVVVVSMTSSVTSRGPRSCRTTSNSESPFACDSVWNARLPTDASLASTSSTYTATLDAQLAHYGAWINSYSYSIPVYKVGPSQPRVPVTLDIGGSGAQTLAAAFHAGAPIPANAVAAAGTDQSMVVWQPSSDTLWEFCARPEGERGLACPLGRRHAQRLRQPRLLLQPRVLGRVRLRPLHPRRPDQPFGAALRPDRSRPGHGDPPCRRGPVGVPRPADRRQRPERERDSEGTRFRLNPRINVASLHLPRFTEMVALAAQRYGIIVRDQSGAVSLYVQQPSPGQPSPYYGRDGLFGGQGPSQLLHDFPWRDLEVVQPPASPR